MTYIEVFYCAVEIDHGHKQRDIDLLALPRLFRVAEGSDDAAKGVDGPHIVRQCGAAFDRGPRSMMPDMACAIRS